MSDERHWRFDSITESLDLPIRTEPQHHLPIDPFVPHTRSYLPRVAGRACITTLRCSCFSTRIRFGRVLCCIRRGRANVSNPRPDEWYRDTSPHRSRLNSIAELSRIRILSITSALIGARFHALITTSSALRSGSSPPCSPDITVIFGVAKRRRRYWREPTRWRRRRRRKCPRWETGDGSERARTRHRTCRRCGCGRASTGTGSR